MKTTWSEGSERLASWQDASFSVFTQWNNQPFTQRTACHTCISVMKHLVACADLHPHFFNIQVEYTWDLVRDSGQRKLTYSSQNHCTLHFVSVGAKSLSPRQCAPSQNIYLSRRFYSHWERFQPHLMFCNVNLREQQKVELRVDYMRAWHEVPSRKWDKTETNSNKRIVVKFSSCLLLLARPRECVWGCCFCSRVRGSGRR